MLGSLSIAKQGLIIVLILLGVELVFVATIISALQETTKRQLSEKHVFDVVAQSSRISNLTQALFTDFVQEDLGIKDMLGSTAQSTSLLANQLAEEFRTFEEIAKGDRAAQAILEEQQKIIVELEDQHKEEDELKRQQSLAKSMLEKETRTTDRYDQLLFEYGKLSDPRKTTDSISELKQRIVAALLLNLFGGMALALLFVNRLAARIGQLCANIARFQNKETLLRSTGEFDEIGKLDKLFREMVAALNQTSRNEAMLVEDAHDVICSIDSEGIIRTINAACLRQWGYKKDAVVGQHFGYVVWQADVESVTRQLNSLTNKSTAINFDAQLKRADGKLVASHWSCYWSNKDRSSFCFIQDVSELNSMEAMLKAREEQVRSLMRNLPIGLMVVDNRGVIKTANNKMESLLKYPRGSLLMQDLGTVLTEHHTPSEILASGDESVSFRCNLKMAGGESLAVELVARSLDCGNTDARDGGKADARDGGKTDARGADTLIVAEDIRERVHLENLKRNFVSLLRETLRGRLLEVRTMIGTASSAVSDARRGAVERIMSSSDRLLRLIDELLTVEAFHPGKLVGELKPHQVSAIVDTAVDSLRDYAAKRDVTIALASAESAGKADALASTESAVTADTSIVVMADFDRVMQVIVNLLSNAIKFSPEQGRVTVEVRDAGDRVEIAIIDQGRGVPLELQETIFRPYEQASAEDVATGTGLGLPICKTIVEAHLGTIGVSSEGEGKGSKFWFQLPREEKTSNAREDDALENAVPTNEEPLT